MSKKLWYGLAGLTVTAAVATSVMAHITKPNTQEFARTFTVTEKRYGLVTLNPATYKVTLQAEGGNEVRVRPDRKDYMLFPSVDKPVTLTYESADEGGRLITDIVEVKYGN